MKKERNTIKSIYDSIRELLFKMIPERWESIYLYASVIDDTRQGETGEMFFYYYPKSIMKKNPINVYEVPSKFNINEDEYMEMATSLYEFIKALRHKCIEIDNIAWSNVTISIENVEFLAEYNLDDLMRSPYTSDDRRLIWKYKYLNYPIEKMNKQERNILQRYLQEEEWGQHRTTIYSETFYQKHIHNNVQYNEEQLTEGNQFFSDETMDDSGKTLSHLQNSEIEKSKKNIKNQLLKYNEES